MVERRRLKELAQRHGAARFLLMPLRLRQALGYYAPQLREILRWVVRSREYTNFTYEYTDRNLVYLAHLLAVITGRPLEMIEEHLKEPGKDARLAADIIERRRNAGFSGVSDPTCYFGKRLAWYAIARATKPRMIVEAGVGFGLASVLLSCALLQNTAEGHPGKYLGVDLDRDAGFLLGGQYREVGRIVYGDSVQVLETLEGPIDFFISDSHVSAELEYREYEAVQSKLAPGAIITTSLAKALPRFARETGRNFVAFKEEPRNHWFPGAWIGFAFHRNPA
jgi:predicted O-methyltransferase YrrM